MKALFVYTDEAQASASHLNSVRQQLITKYAPDYYESKVDCSWSQSSTHLNLPFDFQELDIIFVYMTNGLDSCAYLDSFIVHLATQHAIKLVFIYAEDFASNTPLTIALQSNSSIVPISAIDDAIDSKGNVSLDKNGNPLPSPPPTRHPC